MNCFGRKLGRNAAAHEKSADFGGEEQSAIFDGVIERLDAQGIACDENSSGAARAALRHFDHCKRKHSLQMLDALLAPLFVAVDDYFCVGACTELVAL